MLSNDIKRLRTRKRFAELAARQPQEQKIMKAKRDTHEAELITKTRKIIAASNRALRESEAVLKRR